MEGKRKVVERNMIVKNKVLSTFQNIGGQSAILTPLSRYFSTWHKKSRL